MHNQIIEIKHGNEMYVNVNKLCIIIIIWVDENGWKRQVNELINKFSAQTYCCHPTILFINERQQKLTNTFPKIVTHDAMSV